MNPRVRFEDEAEAEYRAAGRWYEERRTGLGLEFLDAVDATIDQIVGLPHAGGPVRRLPSDLPVRRAPVKRFRTTSSTSKQKRRFAFSRSPMIDGGLVTGRAGCRALAMGVRQPTG